MNFNKKFKGQVQHSATQNVNANPLTGITTSFDGIMVNANKRFLIGFAQTSLLGVAGTNTGIICQPNTIYDFPFNQIRNIGVFTTEASTTVNFVLYDEEN